MIAADIWGVSMAFDIDNVMISLQRFAGSVRETLTRIAMNAAVGSSQRNRMRAR